MPLPAPGLLTVSAKVCDWKAAVTDFAALIVTVQVAPETESHPVQPANVDPEAAVALSVTDVPV